MFRKAERKQAKLRLALCSPSGGGKTYTSLLIAQGLAPGGKVALIDTEAGSGELYADMTPYDVAPLSSPYTPSRYIEVIEAAGAAGYDVLIIDSLSHAWAGEGGVLELHDRAAAAVKNSFAAWREVTPQHNALVEAILRAPLHVIVTMRTKTAYEVIEEGGKKKPVKIGLAPIQRDGLEYEFTLVMDLTTEGHIATATKDRTGLFDGQHFPPTVETGEALREWLETGADPTAESKKILRRLKAQVGKIESVPRLNDWWRKNAPEIAQLVREDAEKLKGCCALRKSAILASREDEPKGNGQEAPAGIDAIAGAAH